MTCRLHATLTAAAAVLAMLCGCAGVERIRGELHFGQDDAPEGRRLLWPQAPEVPRFVYTGTLTGEQNFRRTHETVDALKSFGRWLVGLDGQGTLPVVLQRPAALVGDEQGRLYVSDTSRQALFVFDEKAGELMLWEQADAARRFVAPSGVALAPGGGVYVADAELGAVFALDEVGRPTRVIGRGQLTRPTGLARDARHGWLYVADTYAHDIKVFSDAGVLLRTIGRRGEAVGEFNYPTHLAFARGELYVTDTMNNRIQVITVDVGAGGDVEAGTASNTSTHTVAATGMASIAGTDLASSHVPRQFGSRGLFLGNLVRPKGVSVDGEGNVYVVESYYDSLLVFSAQGEFLMPIGGTGTATGRFYLPAGVWVDARNRVFVADMFNGRIVLFQFLGGG